MNFGISLNKLSSCAIFRGIAVLTKHACARLKSLCVVGNMSKYKPNVVPLFVRILNKVIAVFLILYGGYGLYINDLALPDKRGWVLHLSDEPLWIMYSAFICGALVYLAEVIDHYDKRDNEHKYKNFGKVVGKTGWGLFIISLTLWVYHAT